MGGSFWNFFVDDYNQHVCAQHTFPGIVRLNERSRSLHYCNLGMSKSFRILGYWGWCFHSYQLYIIKIKFKKADLQMNK